MKGLLLFLTALVLVIGFFIPVTIYTVVSYLVKRKFSYLNDWFFDLAISVDQFGNVAGCELFNLILITNKSYNYFGNPDETISSVIGKNEETKTLTFFGRGLNFILNLIENNHSFKSIERDEKNN